MRIEVFLDGDKEPLEVLTPPEKFKLNTSSLTDGHHTILFRAIEPGGASSEKEMTFRVENGPGIAVHGIVEGDTISGEVDVLANAYLSKIGDEFEPIRMETPAPVPTWAWVLFLTVIAWGAGYISLELHDRLNVAPALAESRGAPNSQPASAGSSWTELGAQVYGNNCASCHQANGTGLSGVFPPLVGNPAVLDADPTDHIIAIISGLSGKAIDGVAYAAAMPPFGATLSDEEVSAVVNHERSNWGNNSQTVEPGDIPQHR